MNWRNWGNLWNFINPITFHFSSSRISQLAAILLRAVHSSLLHTLISPPVDFWQFLFHHDWNILLWILAIQSSSCAIVHQYTFSCNSIQKCIWHLRRIQIFEVSSNWNCILLQKVQLFKWRQQSFGTYSIVKCYIILNWECFFLPNNLERKTNCTAKKQLSDNFSLHHKDNIHNLKTCWSSMWWGRGESD